MGLKNGEYEVVVNKDVRVVPVQKCAFLRANADRKKLSLQGESSEEARDGRAESVSHPSGQTPL